MSLPLTGKWITSWACAHRRLGTPAESGKLFEFFVPNNLRGSYVRLRYCNFYGREEATVGYASVASTGNPVSKARGEDSSVPLNIPPGQEVYGAPIRLDATPGSVFSMRIAVSGPMGAESGNFLPGNGYISLVRGAEVLTDDEVKVLACFGDSITHHGHWSEPLRRSLYESYPGRIAVFETGISGNRLIAGDPGGTLERGHSGMIRIKNDVLTLNGLTHVIVALGSNDIGYPGNKEGVPDDEMPSLDDFSRALKKITEELRASGVFVIGAAIAPRIWRGGKEETRDKLRLAFNDWILHSGNFDAVLDFSSRIASKDGLRLMPQFDSGDGIHINAAGGALLAASVPHELFFPLICQRYGTTFRA
jgi:lysophospholipase L1-like esterase